MTRAIAFNGLPHPGAVDVAAEMADEAQGHLAEIDDLHSAQSQRQSEVLNPKPPTQNPSFEEGSYSRLVDLCITQL